MRGVSFGNSSTTFTILPYGIFFDTFQVLQKSKIIDTKGRRV